MAGNQIDINLSVRDQGDTMKQRRKDAESLNQELERSRTLNKEYGVARSAVGTGAAGRDFAQQAQGLGGLVRVYATFAANLFAAQAAFSALSNAMDTTNMISGMNQLGAASGTALGSLAKNFANVTQGAISFREAAQAVTKATAAGLGADQALKIAEVATKASQALGVDLSDAVSRLSRGITKLEPELLDELGIFTKIEPAVDAYALKIGKASSQLSDFERRQAFAVAVLEEGNKKFSEINIDTNPYLKLIASLKDVAYTGLSAINTVLAPIAKILSESPLGLSAAIAAVAAILVKQAIPALSTWRTSIKESAVASAQAARSIVTGFGEQFVARHEKLFDIPNLQKAADKYTQEIRNIDKTIANTRDNNLRAALQNQRKTLIAEQADTINKLNAMNDRLQQVSDKPVRFGTGEWQRQILATRAENKALRSIALSNIAETAEQGGLRASFSKLREELSNIPGLFNKIKLAGVGAFISIGVAASTALAVIQPILIVAGLITAAGTAIYEALRGGDKEIEATKKAFEEQTLAAEAANKTLEKYNTSLKFRTIEASQAAATSLETVSNNLQDIVKSANAELSGGSWWYNIVEKIQNMAGFGTQVQLTTKLVENLSLAFRLLENDSRFFDKFKQKATSILGIDKNSTRTEIIRTVEAGISPDQQKQLADAQKLISMEMKASAEETKAFNLQLTETAKTASQIVTSLLPSTGIAKWAFQGFENIVALNKELEKGADNLDEFVKLVNSTDLAKKFDPQIVQLFISKQADINRLYQERNNLIDQNRVRLQELYKAENKALEERDSKWGKFKRLIGFRGTETAVTNIREQIQEVEQANLKIDTSALDSQVKEIYNSISKAQTDSIVRYARELEIAMKASAEKANLTLLKGTSALITEELPKALLDYKISIAETAIQREQLQQTINLISSIENNSIELAKNTMSNQQKQLTDLKSRPADRQAENADTIQKLEQSVNVDSEVVKLRQALMGFSGNLSTFLTTDIFTKAAKDVQAAFLASSTIKSKTAISGGEAQMAELNNQDIVAKQVLLTKQNTAEANLKIRDFEKEITLLGLEKQRIELQTVAVYATGLEKLQAIQAVETDIFDKTTQINSKKLETEVVNARATLEFYKQNNQAQDIIKSAETNLKLKEKELTKYKEIREQEAQLLQQKQQEQQRVKAITDEYTIQQALIQANKDIRESQFKLEDANRNAEKSRFDTLASLGRYSEQEIQDKNTQYTIETAIAEGKREQLRLEDKLTSAREAYNRAVALGTDSTEIEKTRIALQAAEQGYRAETDAIKASTDAKVENAKISGSVSVATKKWMDVLKGALDSVTDAIVQFALNGKSSFKDLANSIGASILKMTINTQLMKMFGGSGGTPGLLEVGASVLSNTLTPGGATPGATTATAKAAKNGAIYKAPIEKFAQGGMFTNSVVAKPTLFKFAKGTGLMGEAGPEAIMPLTRDSTGKLGVTASNVPAQKQQNVEVVVNNYSNTKAQAVETTDSRGNKKIEVIVGDIVAGEFSRKNSNLQQSMASNFNFKPAVTRR